MYAIRSYYEKLYKKFVNSSDEAKLCALKIAEANLFNQNGKPDKKSFKIKSNGLLIFARDLVLTWV